MNNKTSFALGVAIWLLVLLFASQLPSSGNTNFKNYEQTN